MFSFKDNQRFAGIPYPDWNGSREKAEKLLCEQLSKTSKDIFIPATKHLVFDGDRPSETELKKMVLHKSNMPADRYVEGASIVMCFVNVSGSKTNVVVDAEGQVVKSRQDAIVYSTCVLGMVGAEMLHKSVFLAESLSSSRASITLPPNIFCAEMIDFTGKERITMREMDKGALALLQRMTRPEDYDGNLWPHDKTADRMFQMFLIATMARRGSIGIDFLRAGYFNIYRHCIRQDPTFLHRLRSHRTYAMCQTEADVRRVIESELSAIASRMDMRSPGRTRHLLVFDLAYMRWSSGIMAVQTGLPDAMSELVIRHVNDKTSSDK